MSIEIIIDGKTKTVTKKELFNLASQGKIGPDTPINVNGKLAMAGKVKGIEFGLGLAPLDDTDWEKVGQEIKKKTEATPPAPLPGPSEPEQEDYCPQCKWDYFYAWDGNKCNHCGYGGGMKVKKTGKPKPAPKGTCPNCGVTYGFSWNGYECRHCGDPGTNAEKKSNLGRVIWVSCVLLLLVSVSVGIYHGKEWYQEKNKLVPASDFSDIFEAARNGTVQDIKYFIQQGASVEKPDKDGNYPIHFAVDGGNLEVVKHIVSKTPFYKSKKAIASVKDKDGITPLHKAVRERHIEIVEYLFSQGADVSVWDHSGDTPLHAAAKSSYSDAWNCLIELGADTKTKNRAGKTASSYRKEIIEAAWSREDSRQAYMRRAAESLDEVKAEREAKRQEEDRAKNPKVCTVCNGQGNVPCHHWTGPGADLSSYERCPQCRGSFFRNCISCNGRGISY